MRNLLAFIWKHYAFFLFLLLETVSIYLVVQNNYYQKASFINSSNKVSGNVYSVLTNVTQYFYLKDENERLAKENAILHSLSTKSFVKTTKEEFIYKDTLFRQQYKYLNAKVVNNSINKRNNYITLDKGSRDGVTPESAVICSDGVVGIVTNVSDNFSSVLSVLHKDAKVSARIKNSNYFGSLVWEGGNYRIAKLIDIPTHVPLKKGDTLETNAFSGIFPEGILVGYVEDFEIKAGRNFYDIQVRLSTDYKKVTHVFVVNNLLKGEQLQLEKSSQND